MRVVLDDAKTVVARKDYEPYGEVRAVTGEAPRQGYIGKEMDRESDLAMHGVRAYSASEGRFLSIDPLLEKFRAVTPYQYSLNNPVGLLDADGEKPYTFYVRSFHKDAEFSLYRGDNRDYSTAEKGVTSRIWQRFTLETDMGGRFMLQGIKADCDWTQELYTGRKAKEEARQGYSLVDRRGSIFRWWTSFAGRNRLVPSWDIDVRSTFEVTEDKDQGLLTITALIEGDGFPDAEAFVVDQKGQGVFLGTYARQGNPYLTLMSWNGFDPMIKANFQIAIDRAGNFTEVIMNGKSYSISQWNERQKKNPQ